MNKINKELAHHLFDISNSVVDFRRLGKEHSNLNAWELTKLYNKLSDNKHSDSVFVFSTNNKYLIVY